MRFIPNGYDLSAFQQAPAPNFELKPRLNLDRFMPLIGAVGRFDPQKGHANLLDALTILRDRGAVFRCLLVGTGLDSSNVQLVEWIAQRGLANGLYLLGRRNDVPSIMNALDLHRLPSSTEAFPNVVVEAMACGTPCVVTDVGDAADIVGDTGWVVPPRDAHALAEAILISLEELNSDNWQSRCNRARQRIEDNFSIQRMVKRYNRVWAEALNH